MARTSKRERAATRRVQLGDLPAGHRLNIEKREERLTTVRRPLDVRRVFEEIERGIPDLTNGEAGEIICATELLEWLLAEGYISARGEASTLLPVALCEYMKHSRRATILAIQKMQSEIK